MRLRPDQYEIATHPAKTKVLTAGRRWGKTVLGGACVINCAGRGGRVAWVVPEYRNGRPLWRMAETSVAHMLKAKLVSVNESERLMRFKNGGSLGVYSADNPSSILGEAFNLVVIDEAARIREEVWYETIQPTLADVAGDAILISTPKGRNWFWREWTRGQEGRTDIASWQCPTSANPNPNIQQAALLARDRVPERTYQQEWLAQFIDSGGGVFRRVREAATAERHEQAVAGHSYGFGVDWGRSNDFTFITVWDLTLKALVAIDRFNMIDYAIQLGRLRSMYDRFTWTETDRHGNEVKHPPQAIIAEANSMGGPLVEALQGMNLPVQPFTTTNASKAMAIDALTLAIERGDATIINDPVLVAELEAYESTTLPGGLLRYSAPEGMHDDGVMSAALGWQNVAMTIDSKLFY